MSQTEMAVKCLECDEIGEGNMPTLQCGACLRIIHSQCLKAEKEGIQIENVLNIELFRSVPGLYYICKLCKLDVDAFFVNMTKNKVIKEIESEEKPTESAIETNINNTTNEPGQNNETPDTASIGNVGSRETIENANHKKRTICKFFNAGYCLFYKNCKNIHPDTRKYCRYYLRNGKCYFNDDCKYVHPTLCKAAQQNKCLKKSCDFFHAPPPSNYESQDQKRHYENHKYQTDKNENRSDFLEKIMKGFQHQLEYMQKMIMSQNQRGPINPPIYPQPFPPMPFPPPPLQPPLGRQY